MAEITDQGDSQPLWEPTADRIAGTNLARFISVVNGQWGAEVPVDYAAIHRFSIDHMDQFWRSLWDFAEVIGDGPGDRTVIDGDKMPGAKFFPDAKVNFAENLLRKNDDTDAIVFRAEDKAEQRVTWRELNNQVSLLQQALKAHGIGPGDRVAGFVPNMPGTVAAMLAATSLGAIWTSCSPDFGVGGVVDRFGQSTPRVLFTADGYFYNGKAHDSLGRVKEFLTDLPFIEQVVVMPLVNSEPDVSVIPGAKTVAEFTAPFDAMAPEFTRLPFNSPLYIMYSSGTTGKPKCITHGTGGVLLTHLKEHMLQCDVKPGDRVFYFTTCGWMMWNWLVTGLAAGATLMLFDGSPFKPDGNVLFDFAEQEKFTLFGTSAKYIDALSKAELRPADTHDLSTVRTMTSTGSPLAPESFAYVYDAIKADIQLASITGGTDIVGCFMGGNPLGPVWKGEIQAACLGMAVEIFDDDGKPVTGEQGELVCTRPFPTMPLNFWGDDTGEKYHAAYFEKYDNIWTHGDFVEQTEHGGFVMYGRSDATLNPGGVRIGTAEIYNQVETFPEIAEAIVIGQNWDNDTRVVLFVRLQEGEVLNDDLIGRIRTRIRINCTPRHVPAKVIAVTDIPRTRSGKITELAVRDVVHGRTVKNQEALANPEALQLFADLPELAT